MIDLIALKAESEQDLLRRITQADWYTFYSVSRPFVEAQLAHWEQGIAQTGGGCDYHLYWKQLAENQWIVIKISLNNTGYFDDVIDYTSTAVLWKYQRHHELEARVNAEWESFVDTNWDQPDVFTFLATFDVVFQLNKDTK